MTTLSFFLGNCQGGRPQDVDLKTLEQAGKDHLHTLENQPDAHEGEVLAKDQTNLARGVRMELPKPPGGK